MAALTSSSLMLVLYSTVFVFGSTLLFWFLLIRNNIKSKLPPGPHGWPIVGNLFQLGKKPNESLFGLAKKYGPLMSLRLGKQTAVVVSSGAMAKQILKDNDQLFAGRNVVQAVKCVYGANMGQDNDKYSLIWSQYGPRWRMLRKICNTRLFSAKRLNALQHLRRDQVFQTVRVIYDEDFLKGKTVNIGHIAFVTGLNLIFSQNILARDSEAAEELKETISKAAEILGTPNTADFFPFLRFLDPQGLNRAMARRLKQIHERGV